MLHSESNIHDDLVNLYQLATWRLPDVVPVFRSCFSTFWPNFYSLCAETAISEFPIEILTPTLDSATAISYVIQIFWRSVGTTYSAYTGANCTDTGRSTAGEYYHTIQYKTYNAPYVTKMLFVGAGKKLHSQVTK